MGFLVVALFPLVGLFPIFQMMVFLLVDLRYRRDMQMSLEVLLPSVKQESLFLMLSAALLIFLRGTRRAWTRPEPPCWIPLVHRFAALLLRADEVVHGRCRPHAREEACRRAAAIREAEARSTGRPSSPC